jgi:hypothetical protein
MVGTVRGKEEKPCIVVRATLARTGIGYKDVIPRETRVPCTHVYGGSRNAHQWAGCNPDTPTQTAQSGRILTGRRA